MKSFQTLWEAEILLRQNKIRDYLKAQEADACLLHTPVNVYYASGEIIIGYVYIPVNADAIALVKRPNTLKDLPFIPFRKIEELPSILESHHMAAPKKVVVEGDDLSYGEWNRVSKALNAELINGSVGMRTVRSVKTDYEIQQLRISADKQSEVLRKVPGLYQPGMTDDQFSAEVEHEFRKAGCLGLFRIYGSTMESFMGSVLAGDNACTPSPYDFALGGAGLHNSLPLGPNGSVVKPGQTIMVDINGNFTGYIADQSRTFSVGQLPQMAYDAHNVSIEIHRELAKMGVPGTPCELLYQKSLEMADKAGLANFFMGYEQKAKFVGHGIGLVINELPILCNRNKVELQVGNTIAIEPKFTLPGVGAVGIENSYLVTENGLVSLTSAPEEIIRLD